MANSFGTRKTISSRLELHVDTQPTELFGADRELPDVVGAQPKPPIGTGGVRLDVVGAKLYRDDLMEAAQL